MNFNERLQKAIQRGQRRSDDKARLAKEKQLSEDELKRLHTRYRLQLSEHIESCLKNLPSHFPGFDYQTVFGERGWGASCSRDDIRMSSGRRNNDYSRLEMTIRPYSESHVVDLATKGTIRNKEVFSRNHFEKIEDADDAKFIELIDLWILEYAELYAAKN
ncbi:MAG: hypothetical protein QF918_13405 [Pirellulaceae bacterium]|jgi:hypothetical protein|nr:hypothetical protein [Pirellulaceae bacterium]MDP6556693.1 hypothetical protein [Pirellulaceae bacterium]MDP6722300.1 hypothetical protein [Pirellulaceae bacterium]